MIVSHRYRYLFIEVPLTASWAIRQELLDFYGGEPFLTKHAGYAGFRREVGRTADDYFVFATVRNPLDKVVSFYYKLKTDHSHAFTEPAHIERGLSDYADRARYRFVQDQRASFEDFLRRYYAKPYSDMLDYQARRLDFLIRFENLQVGFTEFLQRMGLEQVRPVPVVNPTDERRQDWRSYYPADLQPLAQKAFAPYMARWQYAFPGEWPAYQLGLVERLHYRTFNILRGFYLAHVRYSNTPSAKFVRRLRAQVSR